jgi:putative resolvase
MIRLACMWFSCQVTELPSPILGVPGQKFHHCPGEEVVAIAGDHMPGTAYVDEVDLREPGKRFGVGQVVVEVGSGVNGRRPKLVPGCLSDPSASVIVVERDRLAGFGVQHLQAAQGRRIVVVGDGYTPDDRVREVSEVLTRMCAGWYGRRGARTRAMRALTAANHDPGQVA